MRLTLLLCTILIGGCAIWREGNYTELTQQNRNVDGALVITDDQAYELRAVHMAGGNVLGIVVHAWDVRPGRGAQIREDEDAAPDTLAERLRWRSREDMAGLRVDIP